MNNSTYRKMIEGVRKWLKVRLVNIAKGYEKYVSEPSFVSQKIFSKYFGAVHEIKPVLRFDKPIYVGFSILDLSKLLMYEFHWKYIAPKYDNCAKSLFKDTNNLIYAVKTNEVYEDFYEIKICLISATIQKIQNCLILSIKKWLIK